MASSLPLPSSLALLVAILTALIFPAVVEPTTYQVSVGQHGISYDPNTINTRNVGDKVVFNFYNVCAPPSQVHNSILSLP